MGNFPRYIPEGSLVPGSQRHPLRHPRPGPGPLRRGAARLRRDGNHVHLLLIPEDAKALADFMCYFNGNLAKEAGRLYRWREKFWGRRYRAIVVSGEPEAQASRQRYLLANGH